MYRRQARTIASTYLGEEITHDIYWNGSIGAARKDLDQKVLGIRDKLALLDGDARVSVLRAVVTQASSAIPMMLLCLSLLLKVMKEQGTYEGCIEQVDGLCRESLYGAKPHLDEEGRLRADHKGLQSEVQSRVEELWDKVANENPCELTDFAGYKSELLNPFGFEVAGVDYGQNINPDMQIANLIQT